VAFSLGDLLLLLVIYYAYFISTTNIIDFVIAAISAMQKEE
jgi:hypothetical protein